MTGSAAAGAVVVGAYLYSKIPGDGHLDGDGSCPACQPMLRGTQQRMEQEAERQNIRNQDNSGNQGDSSKPQQEAGEYSPEDKERMRQGKAPIGNDGKPKELHHPNQDPKAPVREMTRTEHRGRGNYKVNHPHGNKRPSRIDRKKFAKEREQYWKDKAKKLDNQ